MLGFYSVAHSHPVQTGNDMEDGVLLAISVRLAVHTSKQLPYRRIPDTRTMSTLDNCLPQA